MKLAVRNPESPVFPQLSLAKTSAGAYADLLNAAGRNGNADCSLVFAWIASTNTACQLR
jgi:hypothetical protein